MKNEKKVKCPTCDTFNFKEETIYYQKRYYCKVCYESKKKQTDDYKSLIAYICDLYEIESPTGFMLVQIKNFKEQFNYTYKGMELTLDYFYNVKTNNSLDIDKGLGIIPYVYQEAKQYFIDKRDIKNNVDNVNIENIVNQNNIIHVKKSDKIEEDKYKNITIIDITQI